MADGIAGGPATPDMRRQDNNSILGNFLHWMFVGNKPGAGLDAVPGQFLQSINPSSKAGLANLLSMFAGGGKFDASPQMGELGMPNQFEPYSMAKSPVRSMEGQPHDIHELIGRANNRASQPAAKMVHDLIFGGEVHAKGPIPKARLNFRQIRQNAISEQAKTSSELGALGVRKRTTDNILEAHGIVPTKLHSGHPEILTAKHDYVVRGAEHQPEMRVGLRYKSFHEHQPATKAAILRELMKARYQAQTRFHHN